MLGHQSQDLYSLSHVTSFHSGLFSIENISRNSDIYFPTTTIINTRDEVIMRLLIWKVNISLIPIKLQIYSIPTSKRMTNSTNNSRKTKDYKQQKTKELVIVLFTQRREAKI